MAKDDPLPLNVSHLPERTVARWTREFPVHPKDFNDGGDTDYPLELHGQEQEDFEAVAGVTGFENEAMTTLLNSKEVREGKIRTVRVSGAWMSPAFEEGWKLAVDVTKHEPVNGDVVLVYRKDEGTILARWLKAPSGTWLLKDNTATG